MKRLIVLLALAGAVIWTAVALATPSHGLSSTFLSIGALTGDMTYNTGLTPDSSGITWNGKQYTADKLPEFLAGLRAAGVTNLGEWLNLHPAVSAKFGLMPIGLLHNPEVVTQQSTFAPGAVSGWHSHPGYLAATVVSGSVTRYGTDCSSQAYTAGQSFYETGTHTFIVKNLSTTTPAVVIVSFAIPGGTPTTGLRIDEAQPTTCTQ